MKNLFIILLIALSAVTTQQLFSRDADVKSTVFAVCSASNQTINGELEEACGAAQDASNTEFLCSTRAIGANCWVEVK